MDKTRQRLFQLALLIVVIAAIAVMWRYRALISPERVDALLRDYPYAPAAFLGLHLIASLSIFIPRTALGIAAGILFGLWWGLVWAVVGAMIGAWAAFAIARGLGNRLPGLPDLPRLAGLIERFNRGGWRAVWIIRLLPLPHSPVNYAFGVTQVTWRAYSLGSFLGILPSTFFAVGLGAAGNRALTGDSTGWILPSAIGIAAFAVSIMLPKLVRQPGNPDRQA